MIYIVIFFIGIFLIVFSIKNYNSPLKIELKPIFINGYKNNNNISKIEPGRCELKFESGKFYIIQNENSIEDISVDIYHIRVWKYKGALYMAIRMNTHSEYKFLLVEAGPNNEMSFVLMYKLAKRIANKLKVEFQDCGESDPEEEKEEEIEQ